MYHFYFLVTFDNGDSYVLRIKTNYVDREEVRSRAKQVAANRFFKRQDKYELEDLTLGGLLQQLCFEDNLVQFTEGVPMSIFFFQVVLSDDNRIYFVRVQTKFSERKQARAKAREIAIKRFGRTDFTVLPISEDDVFGVIASGDTTGIEIFMDGHKAPETDEQVKVVEASLKESKKIIVNQSIAIAELEAKLATLRGQES